MAIEDLEPYQIQNLPPEKQREIGKMGQAASLETRHRQKTVRDTAKLFLAGKVPTAALRKKLQKYGFSEEDINNQSAIITALGEQALKGNSYSARLILQFAEDGAAAAPLEVRIVDDL